MKGTSVNKSTEVTFFGNNVMGTINKLKKQYKCADPASIYKEWTKNLELNNFTEDHLKIRINPLFVSRKIIDKPNRDRLSYLQNEITSPITTQTSPVFDYVYLLTEITRNSSHPFK